MKEVLASIAARNIETSHPLLEQREKNNALILLITADRGLCGGFNSNITKAAVKFVQQRTDDYAEYTLRIVGKKGKDLLKRRKDVNIDKVYENITGSVTYATAALLGQEIVEDYEAEKYDAVYIIYNQFHSAINQEVTVNQLLPIVPEEAEEEHYVTDFIYEPDSKKVLHSILPKYIEVQVFGALLESVASEHGARMSSMDSATKNASEMINKLTLQYNRARQAAITKELMEIVSGAESIK
jgi:F-type H+-transporting ATPase subunit gamma